MTVVDRYVADHLVKTHGTLYRGVELTRYPIPELPLRGPGRLLDLGSNWGRWTIAAARAGFEATGIDPNEKAIRAARRVAGELGVRAEYVVGDARELPFPDASFDVVHSYSVLQHLPKADVRRVVAEARRVLRPGGVAWIEMPNAHGPLNLVRRARAGEPSGFDMRYWTRAELREAFAAIGPVDLLADGYLTVNPQPADLDLLRRRHRAVVHVSEGLRRASTHLPALVGLADSLVVRAVRT
jgi:SAM-dependent methyltransferase